MAGNTLLNEAVDKFLENENVAICMAAGVEFVTELKEGKDGSMKMIYKTKYPVKIERDSDGKPVNVRVLKS